MAELAWEPGFKLALGVPRMDSDELEEIQRTPNVYIFNVCNRQFTEPRGALGTFIIPACPKGQPVSAPLVLRGWYPETVPEMVEGRKVMYKWVKTSGRKLALDIMGMGQDKHPSQRYEKFGVFIANGPQPTEEEIEKATERWMQTCSERVRSADERYSVNGGMEMGDDNKPHMSITKEDVEACELLGLDRPWARKQGKMMLCENCGKSNVPTASRCVQCQAVFDEEKDRRLFPRDYQSYEERRGPGRPPKVAA